MPMEKTVMRRRIIHIVMDHPPILSILCQEKYTDKTGHPIKNKGPVATELATWEAGVPVSSRWAVMRGFGHLRESPLLSSQS